MTEWLKTDQAVISTYITYLQKIYKVLKLFLLAFRKKPCKSIIPVP